MIRFIHLYFADLKLNKNELYWMSMHSFTNIIYLYNITQANKIFMSKFWKQI